MPNFKIINLAEELKIKPRLVFKHLKIPLGAKVKKGDVIALKKGLVAKKKILAPIEGVLDRLEESTGRLTIKAKELIKEAKLKAVSIPKKAKHVFKGVFGFGQDQGKLLYLKEKVFIKDLKTEYKGSIVACLEVESKGVIYKASALGISGLVVGRLEKELFEDLQKVKDDLDFSLLALSLDRKMDFIKEFDGREVICSGVKNSLIIV